jgi:hypothetical protein
MYFFLHGKYGGAFYSGSPHILAYTVFDELDRTEKKEVIQYIIKLLFWLLPEINETH